MNKKFSLRLRPRALPLCGLVSLLGGLAPLAQAQDAPARVLEPVVVTGNPLGSAEVVAPVSTLRGDALVQRRGATLGETLQGLPGVASTGFGPNVGRPVIRGMDGDRIRILSNSGATVDASSLSFDHAVALDPLVVERIEVLRGPAALLYGGAATGGVVNAIDNRIPREPIQGPTGSAELRVGGASREKGAATVIETGNGAWALHADAFGRDTGEMRVPRFTPPGGSPTERVLNSAAHARGGALGLARTFEGGGHLGASVDTYENRYGIVVEPDVRIRMKRDKLALSGEWRAPVAGLASLRATVGHTDYRHEEVEGSGEVGTTFASRGSDWRIEAEHRPLGDWRGVIGLQGERADFSALGEEAFVPGTRTRSDALFVLEERTLSQGKLSAGVRVEQVRVGSEGDAAGTGPRFGSAQQRRFTLASASLGGLWRLGGPWELSGSASHTERAPTYYELYADGVHLATAAYERGDPAQRKESGRHLDAALQWKQGAHSVKAGAFVSDFSNYIALISTGAGFTDADGEDFPVYAFEGVRARLHGVEIEGRTRLLDGAHRVELDARLDAVRGRDRSHGTPLPRLAPLRTTAGLSWLHGGWSARAEVAYAARQDRVGADDVATGSATTVNLGASRRFPLGGSDALLFVRLENLSDELAWNAGAVRTVRELSPLPGRSLKAGLRLSF